MKIASFFCGFLIGAFALFVGILFAQGLIEEKQQQVWCPHSITQISDKPGSANIISRGSGNVVIINGEVMDGGEP